MLKQKISKLEIYLSSNKIPLKRNDNKIYWVASAYFLFGSILMMENSGKTSQGVERSFAGFHDLQIYGSPE